MSPARKHRERFAAQGTVAQQPTVEPAGEGGPARPVEPPPLSPARMHRLMHGAREAMPAPVQGATGEARAPTGGDPIAAQMMLRLVTDLRRLKSIQSIELKVAAKREMLPAYQPWVDGLLQAAREGGEAVAEEILPTIMVWSIDVGDYDRALDLAEHVLVYDIPLPARYERSAAALVTEEIAGAALKLQGSGQAFDYATLTRLLALTGDADMHDQIRAKLMKAIGVEQQRLAEIEGEPAELTRARATAALETLRRAQQLNDRVGVKDRIKRLEKLLEELKEPADASA